MEIAILGAGNVGRALGTGWARAGHRILFGVNDPEDPKHQGAVLAAGNAAIGKIAQVVKEANVLVLAVPWDAVPGVIEQCGSLDEKVILDPTNPLTFGKDGLELALGFSTSGGEEVAKLARGAAVFKTMNQVGSEVMSNAGGFVTRPVMFVAGDNDERKPLALQLVNDLGFEAVNAGPLKNARLLEPYAMLWIDQALNRGAPRDNAFAFMRRDALTGNRAPTR